VNFPSLRVGDGAKNFYFGGWGHILLWRGGERRFGKKLWRIKKAEGRKRVKGRMENRGESHVLRTKNCPYLFVKWTSKE
jgi:hypothetical protein